MTATMPEVIWMLRRHQRRSVKYRFNVLGAEVLTFLLVQENVEALYDDGAADEGSDDDEEDE